jgi:outer membrane protein assembly factor BamB
MVECRGLRRVIRVLLLATPLVSCGGTRLQPPPPVFPLNSAWSTSLSGLIEGELATDGRFIYASTRGGSVHALDPEQGALVWRSEGAAGLLAAGEGAVVARDADGTVVRLEAESGVVRWRTETGVAGALAPALDARRVFVAGKGAAALDLVSGKPQWTDAEGEASAAPTLVGETLLVGEQDGALRAREAATGKTRWSFATGAPLLAPPAADASGRLFLGTTARQFLAVSLDEGKRLWRWRVGADVPAPAAVLGKSVVFGSHESVLYALDRRNGNLVWRQTLPSRPRSGPLLIGSAVVVACFETDLVGFDGRDGKRLGGLKVASTFATAPVLIGTRLFVGLRDRGTVVAVDVTMVAPVPTPSPFASPSVSPSPGGSPSPGASPSAPPTPSPSPTPTPTPTPRPLS